MIPIIGDIVHVESDHYTGDARVTYIDQESLYLHEFLPIQCEIAEEDLHKIADFNSGQTVMRFSLKEIAGAQDNEIPIVGDEQITLFDEF